MAESPANISRNIDVSTWALGKADTGASDPNTVFSIRDRTSDETSSRASPPTKNSQTERQCGQVPRCWRTP